MTTGSQGLLRPYIGVLRHERAWRFVIAGLVGRLPISMIGLGIVFLVTSRIPSYALAGALAAAFALAAAIIGPIGARFVDRLGQARVLPVLAGASASGLVLLVHGVNADWPRWSLFLIAVGAGAISPNLGSLVRARWIALLASDIGTLRTAFALESVLDEVVFVLGPPLATAIALNVSPGAPLLLSAGLLLGGSLALAAMRGTDPGPRPTSESKQRHALLLPGMASLTALMALTGGVFGSFEVTTVAFAEEAGNRAATGALLALYAFGSLLSGLVFGARGSARPLPQQLWLAGSALAVVSAPLPFVGSIPALAVFAFGAGLAVAPLLIITVSLVERLVLNARITEALTVTSSGIAVGLAVSAPLSGALIDTFGASFGYLVMSVSALGAFLIAALASSRLTHLLAGHS